MARQYKSIQRYGTSKALAKAKTLEQAGKVFSAASGGTEMRGGRVNPRLETIMRPTGPGTMNVTGPVRRGKNVFRKTQPVRGEVHPVNAPIASINNPQADLAARMREKEQNLDMKAQTIAAMKPTRRRQDMKALGSAIRGEDVAMKKSTRRGQDMKIQEDDPRFNAVTMGDKDWGRGHKLNPAEERSRQALKGKGFEEIQFSRRGRNIRKMRPPR